jgi:hypothetical protein
LRKQREFTWLKRIFGPDINKMPVKVKVKVNFTLDTGHEGPEGK